MPSLSIIVPIYNGEAFLAKCIDSILSQNYTDFELVLVDDGSTDGSLTICHDYEQKDSRVVVFHKDNAGLVAARKSGLAVAKGKYIGFVDCDDYIDNAMYSDLMGAAERDDSDIAVAGIIIDYPNASSHVYNMFPEGFYHKEALDTKVIPKMLTYSGFIKFGLIPGVVVKVFKREILEKTFPLIPDTLNIGEDTAITSYSVMQANSISIVHSAAYHYIQGDDSMIRKFNPQRFRNVCKLYDCLSKIENADYHKQLPLYMSYLVFSVVAECAAKSGYDKKTLNKTIKEILQHEMSKTVLKNADISALGFKDKVKIYLMRYCLVALLTTLL